MIYEYQYVPFLFSCLPISIIYTHHINMSGIVYVIGYKYRIPSRCTEAGAIQHPRTSERKNGINASQYLFLPFPFRSTVEAKNAGKMDA